jgi:hypothetical protein
MTSWTYAVPSEDVGPNCDYISSFSSRSGTKSLGISSRNDKGAKIAVRTGLLKY